MLAFCKLDKFSSDNYECDAGLSRARAVHWPSHTRVEPWRWAVSMSDACLGFALRLFKPSRATPCSYDVKRAEYEFESHVDSDDSDYSSDSGPRLRPRRET